MVINTTLRNNPKASISVAAAVHLALPIWPQVAAAWLLVLVAMLPGSGQVQGFRLLPSAYTATAFENVYLYRRTESPFVKSLFATLQTFGK